MKRLLAIALLVAACGGTVAPSTPIAAAPPSAPAAVNPATAPPSPAATSTDGPSSHATPSPTRPAPTTAGAPERIAVDSIAVVVTHDLLVRSKPGVGADSKKLAPLLDAGREVFVVAGPTAASGYQWYQVKPLLKPGDAEDQPFGWVAIAGKDGQPWLTAERSTCPYPPEDYASFVAIPPLVGLACFGHGPLNFAARLASPEATCGVDIGWTIDPDWLGSTCPQPTFLLADTGANEVSNAVLDPRLDVTGLHPGVEPADWLDVNVTGHYDHAAARTCRGVSHGTKFPLTAAEVVLSCRAQFVITAIETSGYLPGPDTP